MEHSILEVIKQYTSEENAIKSKELTEIFGVKGNLIREEINSLRRKGEPICSCGRGYYYSYDSGELFKTITNLEHRISSINEAVEGLIKAFENAGY